MLEPLKGCDLQWGASGLQLSSLLSQPLLVATVSPQDRQNSLRAIETLMAASYQNKEEKMR